MGENGHARIRRISQKRLGQPSDVDAALLLLTSGPSGFTTGSGIVIGSDHCFCIL
jgi:hypothetical protein